MKSFAEFVEFVKLVGLKPRYFFGISALAALILFMPSFMQAKMGLDELPMKARQILSIAMLGGFVMGWVQLIPSFQRRRAKLKRETEVLTHLYSLSEEERKKLLFCVHRNERTMRSSVINSAVHSLASKGIVNMATGQGNMAAWPYHIPNFVWEHLHENENLLFPELSDENEMKRLYQSLNHSFLGN